MSILPFVQAPKLQAADHQQRAAHDALPIDLSLAPMTLPKKLSKWDQAISRSFDVQGHNMVARTAAVGLIAASLVFGAVALIKKNSAAPTAKNDISEPLPRAVKAKTSMNYIPQ